MKWLTRLIGFAKDSPMPQTQEQVEQRALTDRLIEEHRQANAKALAQLQKEAPRVSSRYLDAMDHAMTIMRG